MERARRVEGVPSVEPGSCSLETNRVLNVSQSCEDPEAAKFYLAHNQPVVNLT